LFILGRGCAYGVSDKHEKLPRREIFWKKKDGRFVMVTRVEENDSTSCHR